MIHGSKTSNFKYNSHGENNYRSRDGLIFNRSNSPRSQFSTSGDNKEALDAVFNGKPFFAPTNTEILVQEGNHAFFHCAVHNIGNQTVSINILIF